MFQDISKNRIKTSIIISAFIFMITLIIYYICTAFNLGAFSIVFALVFSIISTTISYYNCDKIVLKMNNARPATHGEDQKLVNIFDTLMISSGLEYRPKLYVVEDGQPNAFATGRNPKHSVICVTTGLLQKLDYYELEGVIAHEMAHVRNYDILLSAIVTVMLGLVVMLSDIFTRAIFFSNRRRDDDSKAGGFLMIVGIILLILAPVFRKTNATCYI
jgi:heat shock protein HtpX